jgi:hypothetical protein
VGGSAQGGGRWAKLARRLGLTLVMRPGLLGPRTRFLVGTRKNYLLSVAPSHRFNASAVEILVRFPQQSTVLGLREDLLTEPALAAAFGRKRRVPRARRKDLLLGDGTVLMRLTYALLPPSAGRIERVADGLVEALSGHMRPLERVCELCHRDRTPGIYLADGVPAYFCAPCVEQHEQRETEFARLARSIELDYARGLGLGAGAAFAFGLAGGSLAAVPRILAPAIGFYSALPVFWAVGYCASALTGRGLGAGGLSSGVLKLFFTGLGAAVAFTVMNAVATLTLAPVPIGVLLLWSSSWVAVAAAPHRAAALGSAALAGWLFELVGSLKALKRATRTTRVERVDVDPPAPPRP